MEKKKKTERHRKLRLKRKNELLKLKYFYEFVCTKYQSIVGEFENGYNKERNIYVTPQPTLYKQSLLGMLYLSRSEEI